MDIELRCVGHDYVAGRPTLKGIDLWVGGGESVAVVGPSGSGKSTLLAVVGLLIEPTRGTVLVRGQPVTSTRSRREEYARRFSWVFQTGNVLGNRTALDNAVLSLLPQGVARRKAEGMAVGALEAVGLVAKIHQLASSLSGGELQRLCIARAMAGRPEVVLADEPTGQLDRKSTLYTLDALFRSKPPEATLVMATHDPLVAARCHRVVNLVDGSVYD